MTLLDKARVAGVRKFMRDQHVTDEQIDLLLAWLRQEINTMQFAAAMGWDASNGSGSVAGKIAVMLRNATVHQRIYWKKKV